MDFKLQDQENSLSILIRSYQKIAQVNDSYDGADKFDRKCGMSYIGLDPSNTKNFLFKVVDEKRFLLAKIKYGF